jgi:thiamine-phosphate pyrophosphorylase
MTVRLPAICVVTRGRGSAESAERRRLIDRLRIATEAGATMIQVRERQFDDRELVRFLEEVVAAVRPAGAVVIVNERTDLALAAGADGVHLKSDGVPADEVRRIVPAGFVVGRSVHFEEEAVTVAGWCDYLFFGTVFRSISKPDDHPTTGVDALARVCSRVSVPVLAIGGITVENAGAVSAAGASGAAAISLFSDARDIAAAVRGLRSALTPGRPMNNWAAPND